MKLEDILEEIDIKIAGSMGKKREGLLEARDIICKHMGDGWIPVEERLPTMEEYQKNDGRWPSCGSGTPLFYRRISKATRRITDVYDSEHARNAKHV